MIISGIITLYSRFGEHIEMKKYSSKKNRCDIIEKWRKMYPNKGVYIQIKPKV